MRTCTKCGKEKPLSQFSPGRRSPDGRRAQCKACSAVAQGKRYHANPERHKGVCKAYHARNLQEIADYQREWRKENREKKSKADQAWRIANLDRVKANHARWHRENRPRVNAYTALRRAEPTRKVAHAVGAYMRKVLKEHGARKAARWEALVGYTASELKLHLEAQFTDGMTWENHGKHWHIDHERPISSFDLPAEIQECWALSNLRPLEKGANIAKGGSWNGVDPRKRRRTRCEMPPKKSTSHVPGSRTRAPHY